MSEITIVIRGEPGVGKTLMARAFLLFVSAMPGMGFTYKDDDTEDVITIEMGAEKTNMLADFIQMVEKTPRN